MSNTLDARENHERAEHVDRHWSAVPSADVASALTVDPAVGLNGAEVDARRAEVGPNRLAEPPRRSKWLVFLDQFRSGIVYLLGGAAVLAGILGDIKDLVVIAIVLVANAVLGYAQQAKATNALAALERMLVTLVRVRREGTTTEVAIDELVPGDVVLLEAGDRVPADGRFLLTANVAVDEASLTGESVPVEKDAAAIVPVGAPLGDRIGSGFMNTTVVRGRAEMVVTATGMHTEIGRVAELLVTAETPPTPLERQLGDLSRKLAIIASGAALVVFFSQWILDGSFRDAILGAVALAVAAIPEGLPAVVSVTLAVGIARMAKEHAIVKRLHSVETLGSTSVICSDKTGTLTLNQMTACEIDRGGSVWLVEGEGYAPHGRIIDAGGEVSPAVASPVLLPAALCSDAVLTVTEDGAPGIIGDPTEAALVVAAAKAGVDAPTERARRPRLTEVPFDSATKFMATVHRLDPDDERSDLLVCVKGAPDVLLDRSATFSTAEGSVVAVDVDRHRLLLDANRAMAERGLRVLAIATRIVPADERAAVEAAPESYVADLNLEAFVGIVDPPRSEARDAIAVCHRAGVSVKMITGDHGVTAGAIAAQLGIRGEVVTGDDLDAMDDAELAARAPGIGVCARVSPEHKVRVVEALRSDGAVVAMTGDGVNDAAALRRADIGVAMGITGTEVTKEAGDMVLTDDNFATIVEAIRRGRAVYDNILKFVRFQLATAFGAIGTIFFSSVLGLHIPFTALQVLWVNLIADGPTAVALGLDRESPGVMDRAPVASEARILDRRRLIRIAFQGAVTTVGVLALYIWAIDRYDPGVAKGQPPIVAMTMAFTAFVLAQVVNVFSARSETLSVFGRYTLGNWRLWGSVGLVVGLQILITEWRPMRDVFDTAQLGWAQWGYCLLPSLLLLVGVEVWKAFGRRRLAAEAGRGTVDPVAVVVA